MAAAAARQPRGALHREQQSRRLRDGAHRRPGDPERHTEGHRSRRLLRPLPAERTSRLHARRDTLRRAILARASGSDRHRAADHRERREQRGHRRRGDRILDKRHVRLRARPYHHGHRADPLGRSRAAADTAPSHESSVWSGPRFSPDGTRLAYSATRPRSERHLDLRLEGGAPAAADRRRRQQRVSDVVPRWSADRLLVEPRAQRRVESVLAARRHDERRAAADRH